VSQVKLILVESVHRLGEVGDLVSVKPGFARNFLLPQGKAILATEGRVAELSWSITSASWLRRSLAS
jgi:ribosomal protein L9